MTGHGGGGIALLNLLFLVAGVGLLIGIRGFSSWLDLLDLLGVSYIVGLCSITVLATLLLILGADVTVAAVLAVALVVVVIGAVAAFRTRSALPRRLGDLPRVNAGTIAAFLGAGATAATLWGLFTIARVMPLGGGDAFEDWVPRAKVIYYFGTIDTPLFTGLPAPRYPILVPTLQALDFRFADAAYGPDLAFQYWFLYLGFVLAAVSLLRRLVPAWLAWPAVALSGVIPELHGRVLNAQADWPLDLLFALSALLAIVWLRERERWQLICLGIVVAAEIATKQEGLLLVGCLFAALLVATLAERRHAWPPLLAVLAVGYLANLPWRIWWGTRSLASSTAGTSPGWLLSHLGRGASSFWLVLRILFDTQMWLVVVPLALVAAVVSGTLGGESRRTALVYLGTTALAIAGFTYILWSGSTLPLDEKQSSTPIPRAAGAVALVSVVFLPLLVRPLLRKRTRAGRRREPAVR